MQDDGSRRGRRCRRGGAETPSELGDAATTWAVVAVGADRAAAQRDRPARDARRADRRAADEGADRRDPRAPAELPASMPAPRAANGGPPTPAHRRGRGEHRRRAPTVTLYKQYATASLRVAPPRQRRRAGSAAAAAGAGQPDLRVRSAGGERAARRGRGARRDAVRARGSILGGPPAVIRVSAASRDHRTRRPRSHRASLTRRCA